MAEDIKYQINGLPADNIVNIIGSDAGRRSGKGAWHEGVQSLYPAER